MTSRWNRGRIPWSICTDWRTAKSPPLPPRLSNSYAQSSTADKRYLYFLSDRDFNEVLGNIDFEFANPKTTRVYVVTLTADEPSPFPALSDETKVKTEEPDSATPAQEAKLKARTRSSRPKRKRIKGEEKRAETETKQPPRVFKVDLDGIQNRIVALAVAAGQVIRSPSTRRRMPFTTAPHPVQGFRDRFLEKSRRFTPTISRIEKTRCSIEGAPTVCAFR